MNTGKSSFDRRPQGFNGKMVNNLYELDRMLKEVNLDYFITNETAVNAYAFTLIKDEEPNNNVIRSIIIEPKPLFFEFKIENNLDKKRAFEEIISKSDNFQNDDIRPCLKIVSKYCGVFCYYNNAPKFEFKNKCELDGKLKGLPVQNPSTLTAFLISNVQYDDKYLASIYRMMKLFEIAHLEPNKKLFNEALLSYGGENNYDAYRGVMNILKVKDLFNN